MKKPLHEPRVRTGGNPVTSGLSRPAGVRSIRTLPRRTRGFLIPAMTFLILASWAQIPQADSLGRGILSAPATPKPEQPDSVQIRLFKSLADARTLGDRDLEARNLKSIGILFKSRKKIPESEKAFRSALRIAEDIQAKAEIADICGFLSQINSERGDYPAALEYLRRHSAVKDSLAAETLRKRVAELKAGYEADRRELESGLVKKESDLGRAILARRRTTVAAAAAGVLLAGGLALVFFRGRRREKRMTRDLKEANERIGGLSRFKEGLTDMIAHDLRHPLDGIWVHSEGANSRPARAIRQAAQQMLNLVQDVLDVRKFEETGVRLKLGNSLLRVPAERAVEEVRFLAEEKEVRIHNDIVSTMAAFMDAEIVRRVLVNLLTNALKFSNPDGEIWIKAIAGGDGRIRVSVNDTGEGIAPGQIEKVFEKFGRIESRQSGKARSSGLGLAFCKLAVEAHGGVISVESEPGRGSSFTFTLEKAKVPPNGAQLPSGFSRPDSGSVKPAVLSDSDRKRLKPVLKKLDRLKIFEIGEIRNCLKAVDDRDPVLKRWKDEMESAVSICDEARYRELMEA
jgi:signal transduction histidine kinase